LSRRAESTAVVGVGNILMGDEGIGVRVVESLMQEHLSEGIALFDGGTAFYALSGDLVGFRKLVIVDAVSGGGPPGTMYRFTLEDVENGTESTGVSLSLHDIGVVETLKLERLVHRIPEEVVFIGVEPDKVELSLKLSPLMQETLPALVRAVLGELETCAVRGAEKEKNG
jgi:hydrogenase maturation protease